MGEYKAFFKLLSTNEYWKILLVPFVAYFMFFITGVNHGHSMSAVTMSRRCLVIGIDSRMWHEKRLRPVMAFYWLRFTDLQFISQNESD